MGLKESMLEKIEKNSIKVTVNGEKVYLKKSGLFFKEWHVIHPPVNPETGKWNWFTLIFGSKSQAVMAGLVGIIVILFALGIKDFVSSYNEIFSNPVVQQCLERANIALG